MKNFIYFISSINVHIGHPKSSFNNQVKPYIYGYRKGVAVFDLNKTFINLRQALLFFGSVVSFGGLAVFVATRVDLAYLLKGFLNNLKNDNLYFVTKWPNGYLTNFSNFNFFIKSFTEKLKTKTIFKITSKRSRIRFFNNFYSSNCSYKKPDVIVFFHAKEHESSIKEAYCLSIPVIAIVDSNSSIKNVSYVIPANDDDIKSQFFYIYSFIICYIKNAKQAK